MLREEGDDVLDGLRAYIQLASGLTDVTRQKAVAAAKSLAATGGGIGDGLGDNAASMVEQVQTMADDLVATGKANRDLLVGLVRSEIDRAMNRAGVATADDLEALQSRLTRLESKVGGPTSSPAKKAPAATARRAAAKKSPAKKAGAKTSAAKKAAVKKAPATTVSGTTAPADDSSTSTAGASTGSA